MRKKIVNSKLAFWIKDLYQIGVDKHEKAIVNAAMDTADFSKRIENKLPQKIHNIAFIIPGIAKYSGGITSILRLGTYLTFYGYAVSYLDYTFQNQLERERNASFNLKDFRGHILDYCNAESEAFDVVIATSWESFYRMGHFNAYKLYFVQDYEPYFSKLNEKYLLAKNTYELGAHIVSLGKWNIEQIKRECKTNSKLDYISFPYEPREYSLSSKRDYYAYARKKNLKLAVYTKEEGKRIPNIIQILLKKTKEELECRGIVLEIYFFGLKGKYVPLVGKNLGKLNKKELMELYCNCDFGMLASMTNISLVPYEMIATGLPIIEFEQGSFKDFFPPEAAILIDYNFRTLVDQLISFIERPEKIVHMVQVGMNSISNLSWEKTVKEFDEILKSIVEE